MCNSRLRGVCIALLIFGLHGTARASLMVYLELPGVNGESDAPGRPDVTALDSLSLGASTFDATKLVDATSPALGGAALSGTPYASASLLFYDSVSTDTQPDADLVLHTALVSGIQSISLGPDPGEKVSFSFASPSMSLFLELPGVTGESSAPGHAGVIALDSIWLSGNGFSVQKAVDSTSTALASALLSGTPYATATLLLYSNVGSQTQPDISLAYRNALVSSIVSVPSPNLPKEAASFVAAGVTDSVPEPAALWLLVAALAVGIAYRPSNSTA